MRKEIVRTSIISAVLILGILTVISIHDNASGNLGSSSYGSMLLDDGNYQLKSYEQEINNDQFILINNEQKNVDINVKSLMISPYSNGFVFPNTTVMIRVVVSGSNPERSLLYLDMSETDYYIQYETGTGKFTLGESLSGLVDLDMVKSGMRYNQTSRDWEIDHYITYSWDFPKKTAMDMNIVVEDASSNTDDMIVQKVVQYENDMVLDWDNSFLAEVPFFIRNDEIYVRGGTNLEMKGATLHFKGSEDIAPSIDDVLIGAVDSSGNIWEYRPVSRLELVYIYHSIQLPVIDGESGLQFTVLEHPETSVVTVSGSIDLVIDSTRPKVADIRYHEAGGEMYVSFAYEENLAGMDEVSLMYMISGEDGDVIRDWSTAKDVVWNSERFSIPLGVLEDGDYGINIDVNDKVGNEVDRGRTFYFTTDMTPMYDVAVSEDYHFSPNPSIEGYDINFDATVENRGTEAAENFQVEISVNGKFLTSIIVTSLPAGSSRDIRWSWKAEIGSSEIEISADPKGRIPDENPENNILTFQVNTEYLDICLKDYLNPSKLDPEPMERITLTFIVRSIGTLESGPIKIRFFQDDVFQGDYLVPSIPAGGQADLRVDWKVDTTVTNLTLVLDPYNQIYESVEHNNRVDFENPFLAEEEQEPEVVREEEEEPPVVIIPENGMQDNDDGSGGIIWTGNDIDTSDIPEEEDDGMIVPSPVPDDQSFDVLPFVIPAAGIVSAAVFLGVVFAGMKIEYMRYKLLLLLIPLYSKLKKEKIEQGVRFEILGYLKAKPGANYTELKRNLDLNDGSLIHHLRILEREDKIYSKKVSKFKLFYIASYRRQPSIGEYLSPFQQRILELIAENPGIVPKSLSDVLDRSQTDMSYHLAELTRSGYLMKKKNGRHVHYYVNFN